MRSNYLSSGTRRRRVGNCDRPNARSLRTERRRVALPILSSEYRSLLAISRCVSAAFAGMRIGGGRDVAVDA
jgi:hypothetical protein